MTDNRGTWAGVTMRAVLLAGIAALTPAALASAPTADSGTGQFQPPEGPVMISRTVVRSLFDGKEVRATRRYLVQFRREDDGWRIEGESRDVTIDVPPSLTQFAGLERNRAEPNFFPIMLDSDGRLKVRSVPPVGDTARARALALGEMMIAGAIAAPDARNQAYSMLTQVVMAGNGGTAWPADLFNPVRAESIETRDIALPDGSRGWINVTMRSEGTTTTGLPQRFERTVTTELSGTKRTSRETWTFERIKP